MPIHMPNGGGGGGLFSEMSEESPVVAMGYNYRLAETSSNAIRNRRCYNFDISSAVRFAARY